MTYFFGGTFDPPHAGHRAMVAHLLAASPNCTVIVMPAPMAPLRGAEKTFTYRQRFHLLRVMFADGIASGRVKLSVLERRLPPPHYTISTLEALAKYCDEKPILVIGGDQAEKLPRWHRYTDLALAYRFVIFSREGSAIEHLPKLNYEQIADFSCNESSTAVRHQLMALGPDARYAAALAIAQAAR